MRHKCDLRRVCRFLWLARNESCWAEFVSPELEEHRSSLS